jgi:hypothetical protein
MADQMQSWTDGQAKTQILEFVRSVTEPGASFVPARDRIAAFDNDGTLWCEKPMCPQADFLLRRWKEMAQAHPGLARKQSWKAVIEGDQKWLAGILDQVPELTRGVAGGMRGSPSRRSRGRCGCSSTPRAIRCLASPTPGSATARCGS